MNHSYIELDKVLKYIHAHVDDPLPLSLLADYAAYSPYHFSRIFKQKTGLSPLHYVASVKMQKAKDLLLHTNLTIRDIGLEIGQQSLGTFTTRFTERVGMSPAQFRKSHGHATMYLETLKNSMDWTPQQLIQSNHAHVACTIQSTAPFHGVIFVGLFTKPIPAGLPKYGTLLHQPGDCMFSDVQPGTYYVMATAVHWEMDATEILVPSQTLRAIDRKPIVVKIGSITSQITLTLRKPCLDDPPILISLPLLMKTFLMKQANHTQ